MQPEAFFLAAGPRATGQRFCLFYPAQPLLSGATVRALVLYIHPLAEEMNKARRMAALQARALARSGCAVLQIDLLGCGDSSGDFGDATWQGWISDVMQACQWLRRRSSSEGATPAQAPLWLWGLRAGCLLATQAADQLDEDCNFLFWQPPPAGQPLLQQWLRLKLAGELAGGRATGGMQDLRQQLAAGSPVEIGGYRLGAELASGLAQAALLPPGKPGQQRRLEWFEMSTRDDASLSPASAKAITQWQQAGFAARSHLVNGPAFWQSTEIEEAPALIAASTAAVCAATPGAILEARPA